VTDTDKDRERDVDGRYAPEVSKVGAKKKGGRPKGYPKSGGRKKGTPNKASRAWKEFVISCADDTELQERLKERCMERPDLLLRVAEHAVGKPKETIEHHGEMKMFIWPSSQDIAEE